MESLPRYNLNMPHSCPVKTVPASERWLYENAEALASVKKGLLESAEVKSTYRGSFAKNARY